MDQEINAFVRDDELLARYIFSKNHFSNNRVKRHAFMPYKFKVSVMRYEKKEHYLNCLLQIGEKMGEDRNNSLKAIASILTQDIRSINGLDVESDTSNKQHRRHANIKNFNQYTDAKIRQIAQKLAEKSRLIYKK